MSDPGSGRPAVSPHRMLHSVQTLGLVVTYDPDAPLGRDYEQPLFEHYKRPAYWLDQRSS